MQLCSFVVTDPALALILGVAVAFTGGQTNSVMIDMNEVPPVVRDAAVRAAGSVELVDAAEETSRDGVVYELSGCTAEGEGPQADRPLGAGRNRPGRAEHHLRLADDDRLQVRAGRGQRGCQGGRRPAAQEEGSRHQRVPQERQQEGADRRTAGRRDHEGQLHEALQGQVPQKERRLRRRVRPVLQVTGQ